MTKQYSSATVPGAGPCYPAAAPAMWRASKIVPMLVVAVLVLGVLAYHAWTATQAGSTALHAGMHWAFVLLYVAACAVIARLAYRVHLGAKHVAGVRSEERARDEQLRLSEERFRFIARTASDALWDWNLRTGELWWSDGFENLFGFARGEVDSNICGWTALIHAEDRERAMQSIEAAIRDGRQSWVDSYRFRRKDGSYAQVVDRGYVLRDAAGEPVRMVGGMTDITMQQAAKEMMEEAYRQLRALSAHVLRAQEDERARIARELHDEVGQMLTVIKLQLGVALGASNGSERVEAMRNAVRYAEEGVEAVRRLSLDLHPPQLMQFGLEAAVNALLHREVPEDGPTFMLNSAIGTLRLDRTQAIVAFRVVQESVTNVLRHAEATNIEVELSCEDGMLEVAVRDDGKGFDPRAAKRKGLEGRSIGLLGMRERCQNAGGNLLVSAEPGAGCEVRAQLPLAMHTLNRGTRCAS